jgi:hypothetical protein
MSAEKIISNPNTFAGSDRLRGVVTSEIDHRVGNVIRGSEAALVRNYTGNADNCSIEIRAGLAEKLPDALGSYDVLGRRIASGDRRYYASNENGIDILNKSNGRNNAEDRTVLTVDVTSQDVQEGFATEARAVAAAGIGHFSREKQLVAVLPADGSDIIVGVRAKGEDAEIIKDEVQADKVASFMARVIEARRSDVVESDREAGLAKAGKIQAEYAEAFDEELAEASGKIEELVSA